MSIIATTDYTRLTVHTVQLRDEAIGCVVLYHRLQLLLIAVWSRHSNAARQGALLPVFNGVTHLLAALKLPRSIYISSCLDYYRSQALLDITAVQYLTNSSARYYHGWEIEVNVYSTDRYILSRPATVLHYSTFPSRFVVEPLVEANPHVIALKSTWCRFRCCIP